MIHINDENGNRVYKNNEIALPTLGVVISIGLLLSLIFTTLKILYVLAVIIALHYYLARKGFRLQHSIALLRAFLRRKRRINYSASMYARRRAGHTGCILYEEEDR